MMQKNDQPIDIFIEGWGRMGSHWGISKVMAEIYALLYLNTEPLSLEEMSDKLQTSRSNISLNVRALQDVGVVKKVLIRGDRKDYYSVEEDIGKVAVKIAENKKKKELDPALEIVNAALAAAAVKKEQALEDDPAIDFTVNRLKSFKTLLETIHVIFATFIHGESAMSIRVEEPATETKIGTESND